MPAVTLRRKSRVVPDKVIEQDQDAAETTEVVMENIIIPTKGEEAPDDVEGDQAAALQEPAAPTSSPAPARGNFVLVMDNGQLTLVSSAKSQAFQSLPKRGQKLEEDSGTSTPVWKKKKKLHSQSRNSEAPSPRIIVRPLKRGRGRPPKKRSTSRMLEFEVEVEEDEDPEEEEEEEEDGEEEDLEGIETPADDPDLPPAYDPAEGEEEDLVPPLAEQNVYVQEKDYVLRNDELVLDNDEDGDKKIDEKGNLLRGREYNFRTFNSPHRTDKEVLYALSIDAARGAGYRDSVTFFKRNPLLIKLSCTDKEKVMLIEQDRLSGQLRGRNVTMLAVRNVFKIHGAKVVKDGRYIEDDYYEKEAREAGKSESQALEDPTLAVQSAPRAVERRRDAERDRTKRRPDAFTFSTADLQGNAIYTTFGDAGLSPFERAKGWNARRVNLQRADIDEENWMMEMARSVRGMNSEILSSRKERLKAFPRPHAITEQIDAGKDAPEDEEKQRKSLPIGFFEPLTNTPHYSSLTQPSWATLERIRERPILDKVKDDKSQDGPPILGSAKVGSQAWGLASFDQMVRLPPLKAKDVVRLAGEAATEKV